MMSYSTPKTLFAVLFSAYISVDICNSKLRNYTHILTKQDQEIKRLYRHIKYLEHYMVKKPEYLPVINSKNTSYKENLDGY